MMYMFSHNQQCNHFQFSLLVSVFPLSYELIWILSFLDYEIKLVFSTTNKLGLIMKKMTSEDYQ